MFCPAVGIEDWDWVGSGSGVQGGGVREYSSYKEGMWGRSKGVRKSAEIVPSQDRPRFLRGGLSLNAPTNQACCMMHTMLT